VDERVQVRFALARLFPSAYEFKTVGTIPPSTLPAEPDEKRDVELLLRAYKQACQHELGKRCFLYPKGVRQAHLVRALVESAVKFRKLNLPPLYWATWSVRYWKDHKRGRNPPLAMVYSPDRIERQAEWCFSEMEELTMGSRQFPPAWREVMTRWKNLDHEVRVTRCCTLEMFEALKNELFPDEVYAQLKERARVEVVAMRQSLREAWERGDWIW
jgi:hypothetical protein